MPAPLPDMSGLIRYMGAHNQIQSLSAQRDKLDAEIEKMRDLKANHQEAFLRDNERLIPDRFVFTHERQNYSIAINRTNRSLIVDIVICYSDGK